MRRIERAVVAPKTPTHYWRTTDTWIEPPPTPMSMTIESGKDHPVLYFVEDGVTFAFCPPEKAGFV
jgi:hypothetical protein